MIRSRARVDIGMPSCHVQEPVLDGSSSEAAERTAAPKRILVLAACPLPWPRGTPIRATRLTNAFASRGHDVTVATYHLGTDEFDPKAYPIAVHRTPNLRFYRDTRPGPTLTKLLVLDPLLLAKALKLVRSKRFDVIYAHHYESLLIALAIRRVTSIPVIYDAHTLLGSELPYYVSKPLRGMARLLGEFLDRCLPRRADYVVAVSTAIADRLRHDSRLKLISVVNNRVELGHFSRHTWPTHNGQGRTVLFTGNMAAYQGVEAMLDVFARVLDSHRDLRLRIVSNEPLGQYADLARKLGIFDRIDIVSTDFARLPAEIAGASVAVNPRSEGDGIAQKLVNYMAVGAPIVSFAGTSAGLEDGVNAIVVPNGDIARFADGIRTLLDDVPLAKRLGGNARRQICSAGNWEQAVVEIERSALAYLDGK